MPYLVESSSLEVSHVVDCFHNTMLARWGAFRERLCFQIRFIRATHMVHARQPVTRVGVNALTASGRTSANPNR